MPNTELHNNQAKGYGNLGPCLVQELRYHAKISFSRDALHIHAVINRVS